MAFQTALSGLNAAQSNLSVTGNNIANSSTTGFKKSRAEFADIYATSFAGSGSTTIGGGVRMSNVAQQFTQGNVEFTSNNLDLAVSGQGFFVLKDSDGSNQYTRAGAFGVDRDGYVVNSHGQKLQKYAVDANGVVNNFTPSDLHLNTGSNPANATANISLNVNLDANATVPTVAFNASDPNSYNFSTSTTTYDSLGAEHTGTLYFRKTAANSWQVSMGMVDANGTQQMDGPQNIAFTADGKLNPLATTLNFFGGGFNPANGANNMNLAVKLDGSTQYAGESTANAITQDGYTTGRLSGIDIDPKGVVYARYTNGQSSTLGAVAMSNFANPQGLQPVGNTNWSQTFASGDSLPGQAGTGTMGQIQSGALESSNVDLSKQLVNMITAQRDFQANAKMISTEDAVTQTIINIR